MRQREEQFVIAGCQQLVIGNRLIGSIACWSYLLGR